MNSRKALIVLVMALMVSAPAMAQHKSPTEAQCREMTDSMVQLMKSTPIEQEKDKQSARALIERIEEIVKDNRSRGVSECDTWATIGKIVANQ